MDNGYPAALEIFSQLADITGMKSTNWSRWYLVPEQGKLRIKRYRTTESGKKTWQRYPAKQYLKLATPEVESLLRKLNATYEVDRRLAEERYNFNHAFVNKLVVEKFTKALRSGAEDAGHVDTTIHRLNRYVFEFFILQCQIPDPSRWHLKDDAWGEWLLQQKLSARTLKKVVSIANRFNRFLVEKVDPNMETPRVLDPIGKVTLSKLAAKENSGTKYIGVWVFEQIISKAKTDDPDVIPNILLCYNFGLRISETLGITRDKFLRGALVIDEQGDKLVNNVVTRRPVKTKDSRRVPYWNMPAKDAWELVKQIKPMHPDSLIKRVNAVMGAFNHTSHDLRRTFITNALRKYHWKDVQLAVGHKDVRTLMGYNQDDRELGDEKAELE